MDDVRSLSLDTDAGRVETTTVGVDTVALLAVLEDMRALLERPNNDFSWSSFGEVDAALSEVKDLAAKVRPGEPAPLMLQVLFAPTGPLQEVALSSGWAHEYLALADRFDAALAGEATP